MRTSSLAALRVLLLLLLATACREEAGDASTPASSGVEAVEAAPPPSPVAEAEDDAPLPEPDEIPSFLLPPGHPSHRDASEAPPLAEGEARPSEEGYADDGPAIRDSSDDGASGGVLLADRLPIEAAADSTPPSWPSVDGGAAAARSGDPNPSLAELMAKVRFDDGSDEGSFASVVSTSAGATREQTSAAVTAPPGDESDAPTSVDADDDPCASIREAIAKRQDYLERIGAERTAFAYVENEGDASALRLLQGLRRCADFPDDEDCKPRPMEVELRELEPPRHTYESWPTDLEAEHKDPDEIAHDPGMRTLRRDLAACELRQKAQPLLE